MPGFFESLLADLQRRFPSNQNVASELGDALMVALSNKADWQGPPAQGQENRWISENYPIHQSMQHTLDRVNRGELQANMTPIPTPLGGLNAGSALAQGGRLSPFAAFWGRPQITGSGPFVGQAARTVGMRAPSPAVPPPSAIPNTKILDTFLRPAAQTTAHGAVGAGRDPLLLPTAAIGAGTGLGAIGLGLSQFGGAKLFGGPISSRPADPYAVQRAPQPEMIEPIAETDLETSRIFPKKRRR